MLVIRMQRTGRSGHAQFRVVVQDSRRTPTSGKIVAQLGHYNPHTKQTVLDKDKLAIYLKNGAQPSERVARLLKSEGVKLPVWVVLPENKERAIRNPEKLRRNRPAEEAKPEPAEEVSSSADEPEPEAAETSAQEVAAEEAPTKTEEPAEETTPEPPADEPAEEKA